ncbi:MAG TPA: methyltransferase domain-containing protein [Ignavibacteriaceae bacterium]
MFIKRSYKKELMDDFSINDGRIGTALNELGTINKYLGGNSVTKKGIDYFLSDPDNGLDILDIGGGGSDILYNLCRKIKGLNFYSLDLNKFSCHYQKTNNGNNKIICADALKLPLREKSFDLVHTSLFLHHFTEEEIIQMLSCFILLSKRGVVINDLRRNILAFIGIKLLTFLFSKSEFVKYDGPLSVKRAFIKTDLKQILHKAGIKTYQLRRMWAFRFLLIIPASSNEQG